MNIVLYILRLAAKTGSVLLFLLTIASAYGGRINPYIWATPSVLTLALPYFAIATIITTLVWAVSRKYFIALAGAATIIICWGPIIEAVPFGSEKTASSDDTFSLLTFNILHTDDLKQPDNPDNRALKYILNTNADIVCLQEFTGNDEPRMQSTPKSFLDSIRRAYPYTISNPSTDLTLLSKFPAKLERTDHISSRYFYDIYSLRIRKHDLHIVNVHLTPYHLNDEERDVMTDIKSVGTARESIRELKGSILSKVKNSFRMRAEDAINLRKEIDKIDGAVILCGDFNDVPASYAYRQLKSDDLRDAYAETNFGPTFTYNKHLFLFHIDQILYKGSLKALKTDKGKIDTSDHYPLISEFEFTAD